MDEGPLTIRTPNFYGGYVGVGTILLQKSCIFPQSGPNSNHTILGHCPHNTQIKVLHTVINFAVIDPMDLATHVIMYLEHAVR